MVKWDRDGDIQMVGAKVDMDKAKKSEYRYALTAGKRGTKQDVIDKRKKTIRMRGIRKFRQSRKREPLRLKREEGSSRIASSRLAINQSINPRRPNLIDWIF